MHASSARHNNFSRMDDFITNSDGLPYWMDSMPKNRFYTFSAIVTFKNPELRKDLDSFKQFAKEFPGGYARIDGFSVAEKEFAFKKILGSIRNQEIVPTGIISPGEFFIWVKGDDWFPTDMMFDWQKCEWNHKNVSLLQKMIIGFPQTFSASEGFFREVGTTMLYPSAPAQMKPVGPVLLEKEDVSLYCEYDVDSSYIPLHDDDAWSLNTMKEYFNTRKEDAMAAMRDLAVDESLSFWD